MNTTVLAAIEGLQRLKISALRARYKELFDEESKSLNRQYLIRRIAWQLQARAEGGLSKRARQRIREIADDADLRTRPTKGFLTNQQMSDRSLIDVARTLKDWRMPPPGTLLTRRLEGRDIIVKVLEKGFEYQSKRYSSLSAIAREVTGTNWNGFRFFGLKVGRNG
jgi:hypothetical protein